MQQQIIQYHYHYNCINRIYRYCPQYTFGPKIPESGPLDIPGCVGQLMLADEVTGQRLQVQMNWFEIPLSYT